MPDPDQRPLSEIRNELLGNRDETKVGPERDLPVVSYGQFEPITDPAAMNETKATPECQAECEAGAAKTLQERCDGLERACKHYREKVRALESELAAANERAGKLSREYKRALTWLALADTVVLKAEATIDADNRTGIKQFNALSDLLDAILTYRALAQEQPNGT